MEKRLFSKKFIVMAAVFLLNFSCFCGFAAENKGVDFRPQVLAEFFPERLPARMMRDASVVLREFGGVNIFSSCQYGTSFIVGRVRVGDIFDARIPKNYRIFKNYARERMLVLNVSEREHFNKYALAASRFLAEFAYDGVLFYPDEFHPVFTKNSDTWMFLRENPSGERGKKLYSKRVVRRRVAVEGGIPMEALNRWDFPQFYVPSAGAEYRPFRYIPQKDGVDAEDPSEFGEDSYICRAAPEMLRKRRALGIIPSPFSGRSWVFVGAWGASGDDGSVDKGFSYFPDDRIYTWGGCGIYLIPLDPQAGLVLIGRPGVRR